MSSHKVKQHKENKQYKEKRRTGEQDHQKPTGNITTYTKLLVTGRSSTVGSRRTRVFVVGCRFHVVRDRGRHRGQKCLFVQWFGDTTIHADFHVQAQVFLAGHFGKGNDGHPSHFFSFQQFNASFKRFGFILGVQVGLFFLFQPSNDFSDFNT